MEIKPQSIDLIIEAVLTDPRLIRHIDDVTPSGYMSIRKFHQERGNMHPFDLSDIKNQTDKLCLAVVKDDGLQLQYVTNQTAEIVQAAIDQNPEAAKYVRDEQLWI